MHAIAQYFWRLVPGNPILQRVVASGGKRKRDLFFRCGYLGLLISVVVFMLFQSAGGFNRADLTALTKTSGSIFFGMSYVQLALVALLAPVFTAGAITQERDSQTYDILLSTPLTNGQIVLGSLLSRVFFIVALLVSGIPIFAITQIFGGVAISSIVQSFLISTSTALVTGALAMAIASFKVGTRRTIFSFYLFTMLYLLIPLVIEWMGYCRFPSGATGPHISWFTGINPFLAQLVIFNDGIYVPPEAGSAQITHYSRLVQWYLSSPDTFYISFMFFLSFVLVTPSVVILRRMAQSSSTIRGWLLQKLHLSTGDKTRKVRRVWSNPIAWREAKTKASAARATFLRYLFMGAGTAGAITLVMLYAMHEPATRFIAQDGFNPTTHHLSIYDNGTMNGPFSYNEQKLHLTFNDAPITTQEMTPRMAIESYDVSKNTLLSLNLVTPRTRLSADSARRFLLGAVLVEFAVILLIVTQSAASTVTREKEDGTLDLILSTPITSRYYVWGKLRGLVSFAIPLLAIPIFSIVLFVIFDVIRSFNEPNVSFQWIVFPEAIVVLPGILIIVSAFAAILGMQMSLRCRTTVMAVILSVVIVNGICFGLGACGFSALSSNQVGQGGLILGALSPFTLAGILIDPMEIAKGVFAPGQPSGDVAGARLLLTFSGWVITGIYCAVVWGMYKSMVKNFDMTIRKQST